MMIDVSQVPPPFYEESPGGLDVMENDQLKLNTGGTNKDKFNQFQIKRVRR